jgi:hypothetical protein
MFQVIPKIDTPASVLEKITAAFCAKDLAIDCDAIS